MSKLPLVTANLVLRDFSAQDLAAYQALRADPKFQRFSSEDESTPEQAAELLRMFLAQAQAMPRTKFQLAITLQDGTLIGSCGVRSEQPGSASIGCEVGRRWQGTGYAREAGLALVAFGFRELGLASVYAETIPENRAAARLCRALGMRLAEERAGTRHFKGRSWNTAVYTLGRNDWLTAAAGTRP